MGSHHRFQCPARLAQLVWGTQLAYHEHTPEYYETSDRDSGGRGREGLSESSDDDKDQLKTVHLLSSNHIGQVSETQLTKDSSTRCSNLDSSVGVTWDLAFGLAVVEENDTQHGSDQVNGEDLHLSSEKWSKRTKLVVERNSHRRNQ